MGYFFNKNWELTQVPPGVEVPTLAVPFIAMAMGAVFLMFMPFVGFYLTAKMVTKKLVDRLTHCPPVESIATATQRRSR